METATLREKLHHLIDNSSKEQLVEVYTFFTDSYSDEFKAALDEEFDDYQKSGQVISKVELDRTIDKLLYGK